MVEVKRRMSVEERRISPMVMWLDLPETGFRGFRRERCVRTGFFRIDDPADVWSSPLPVCRVAFEGFGDSSL